MKKILFIVPYPKGVAPSQRFRFEQYLSILQETDFSYDISSFWSERAWSILYQERNFVRKSFFLILGYVRRLFLLFRIHQYDFIFLHREATPLGPPILEFAIAKLFKKKIIYDFDDAIWLPNTSEQNGIARYFKYHGKVASICRWSWKVSCGNQFLCEYAKNYNTQTVINPTTIDTAFHKSTADNHSERKVRIGWTGTHSTIKYLNSVIPIIRKLIARYDIEFIVISNKDPGLELENFRFIPWSKTDEIQQLDSIDIGIMPLDNSIWEQGKCGFKALQYMALEKTAVVSNVGVNKQIIDHNKNGYLCNSEADWLEYLSRLINSENLRKSIGIQGRKKVEQGYSVASNKALFLSLFE